MAENLDAEVKAMQHRAHWLWWVVGVVGVLLTLGWSAHGYVASTPELNALEIRIIAKDVKQDERMDKQDSKLHNIDVRNVRIEIGQQMLSDQLELQSEVFDKPRGKKAREVKSKKMRDLKLRIKARKSALKKSKKMNSAAPLAGVDDL